MARTTLRSIIDGPYPLAGIRGAAPTTSTAKEKVSPLAKHVASHLQDPVGSTLDTFGDLSQKKLDYQQAQEKAKMQLAPVKSFIEEAENQHDLNPDAALGYQDPNDPNAMQPGMMGKPGMQMPGMPQKLGQTPQMQPPGLNPNMTQAPGMMQQNKPGQTVSQPGTGPKVAGQPQQQKTAASPAKAKGKSEKKSGGATGRGIKVHVTANSAPGIRVSHSNLASAVKNSAMRFGGPGSGRRPGGGAKAKYSEGRLWHDFRPAVGTKREHNLLTRNGFKFKGTQYDGEGRDAGYSEYTHPKHGEITVYGPDTWVHSHKKDGDTEGYGYGELKDHMDKYGVK